MKLRIQVFFFFTFFLFTGSKVYSQSGNSDYSSDLSFKFLEAAFNGDHPIVAECLKKGVDVNSETWDGVTALIYATDIGHRSIVKLLLEKGADVNKQPLNGSTALISASQYGYTEIAEMLIADSAKVEVADNHKATALHYASLYNNDTIVFMLLGAGANPNVYTKDRLSPLSMAALNGSYESAFLLIDAGALVNTQDKFGFTPLMLATQGGNRLLVELLLNNGASANLQNNKGFSALSLAISNKYPDIVKLLIENGANVKESNSISLNVKTLAKLSRDSVIINTIKKTGAKTNFFPAFKTLGSGIELNFGSADLLTGIFITQTDLKYNLTYNLGFSFRPIAKKIKFVIPEYGYYQFMERRYLLNFDLGKNLNIAHNGTFGVNVGARLIYTFGKYRGTDIHINGGFSAAPQAWIFLKKNNLEARLGYHYSTYGEKKLNSSHITLNFIYHFYNFNNENINRKLKWLE